MVMDSNIEAGFDYSLLHKTWRCFFCANKKNSVADTLCGICNNPRQPSRLALHHKGGYYLCKLRTGFKLPTVTILRVSPLPQKQFKLIIPAINDDFSECIRELLDASEPVDGEIVDQASHRMEAVEPANTALSLFDQVIEHANNLVYDSSFGRYLESSTLEQKSSSPISHNRTNPRYKTEFKYAQSMLRSKVELRWAVEEDIRQSDLENGLVVVDERKKKTSQHEPCVLCEAMFPLPSLVGMVSYKAALDWKINHGVYIDPKDKRFLKNSVHDGAKLCIFCMQFFNNNFSSIIEKMAKEKLADDIDHHSNRKLTGRKSSQSPRDSIALREIPTERPISRLQQKISRAHLEMKSELAKSRFSIQKLASNRSRIVDTSKSGTFLRDKYKDVSLHYDEA
jgi:hypothetical protein